jgi:hypothetical protein
LVIFDNFCGALCKDCVEKWLQFSFSAFVLMKVSQRTAKSC